MGVIRCEPLYKERVWGSDDPDDFPFGTVPSDKPVGEAWEISDRPGEQSYVLYGGKKSSFESLLRELGSEIMGPQWSIKKRFPILVKKLFCQKRLSLQVHPPQTVAREYGLPSKDEFWYVLRAQENAQIFVGLKEGVTRDIFLRQLENEDLEICLHGIQSSRGDALYIPSGRLHALDAGNVILEIQENSDTTFRVYDWGRLGLDGKPRTLHVTQALSSINWEDHAPHVVNTNMSHMIVARCNAFCIHQFTLGQGGSLFFERCQQPRILHVVEGAVVVNDEEIGEGENVILPYSGQHNIYSSHVAKILITQDFV